MTPNERANRYVQEHQSKNFHVDSRTIQHLANNRIVIEYVIESPDEFLALQFHANDASRLLTPHSRPRTLRDVVSRMQEKAWDFSTLTNPIMGFDRSHHHPEWFEACLHIEREKISYESFGALFLMDLIDEERAQTPLGSFSIYDGTHRSLVLAHQLLNQKLTFQPIPTFIFRPRPIDA
jgi:hypothetical protein